MDRDVAQREVFRLIQEYRAKPFAALQELADGDVIESDFTSSGELITLSVDIRRDGNDTVRIHVSAYGNSWWKQERVDESVRVRRDETPLERTAFWTASERGRR